MVHVFSVDFVNAAVLRYGFVDYSHLRIFFKVFPGPASYVWNQNNGVGGMGRRGPEISDLHELPRRGGPLGSVLPQPTCPMTSPPMAGSATHREVLAVP